MLINGVQYNFNNSVNRTKVSHQPAFEGSKPIDLKYVLEKRAYLLPERMLERVQEVVNSGIKQMPTLRELHMKEYSPLLECKTLDEAKKLFPEFSEIKEANISFERITGNIKKLSEKGLLEEGFSLKLLQDFWANLKSQDEFAKELGLDGRSSLAWILQKIGFVNYNTNYKTLLKASDPEIHSLIAAKTTAWNASHPDLMRARNKHAAQFCKTPEYRKAHSERMMEYDKLHPERAAKISQYDKEVWAKAENVRKALSDFMKIQSDKVRSIVAKDIMYGKLTPAEKRIKKGLYARFWKAYPDMRAELSKAHELVRIERANKRPK